MNIFYFIGLGAIDLTLFVLAVVMSIRDKRKYKKLLAADTGEVLFDIKYKKKKIEKICIILIGIIFVIDKVMAIWTQSLGIFISGLVALFIVWVVQYPPEFYVFSKKIKYKNPKGYGGQEGEVSPEDILSITTTDKESLLSVVYITLKTNEEVAVPTAPKGIAAVKEFCRINNIKLD